MRLVAVLFGCLAATPALAEGPATGEQVYGVDTPPALALILNFAAGGGPKADSSAVLDAFDVALAEASALRRARLPGDFGARCLEDPVSPDVCLVRAVAPTFDPLLPNVAQMRMSRLERELRAAPPDVVPSVAVLLTIVPGDEGAALRVRAFSVPAAVRRLIEAQQAAGAPVSASDLEALMERALLVTARRDAVSATDPATYEALFAGALAPLVGAHPPWGAIELTGLPEGATVTLRRDDEVLQDGRPAGARLTRFVDVRPGTYEVSAACDGYAPSAATLEVGDGVARFAFALEAEAGVGRWGTGLAGGLAVVAAAGLVGLAASRAGAEGITCPNSTCPSGVGGAFGATGTDGGDPNDGFPVAPVAAGLGAAGATWIVGALLEGEGDEAPWWSVAIGVAAGALAFGVTYAATGASTALEDQTP